MIVTRLELVDFRNYAAVTFDFHPGITAVVGLNGQGKTNLAEAMAYLARLFGIVQRAGLLHRSPVQWSVVTSTHVLDLRADCDQAQSG